METVQIMLVIGLIVMVILSIYGLFKKQGLTLLFGIVGLGGVGTEVYYAVTGDSPMSTVAIIKVVCCSICIFLGLLAVAWTIFKVKYDWE